jgi:hypothetical protein
MADISINQELFEKIAKLPKRHRELVFREIGKQEWQRCSDDVLYWLDTEKHYIPYVYTSDPHPMSQCLICKDEEVYHFNKRTTHLQIKHKIETDNLAVIRGYFKELPTTRSFPMKPYFEPIIKQWLNKPLILIEKSRDMMATWLVVVLYTWDTFYHRGRQNFFQSETAKKTRELIRRSHFVMRNQPKFLRDQHKVIYGVGPDGAGELRCEGLDSELIGMPQGSDQIRQYHPSGVFTDETAFQKDAGETFAAVKPAIQNGGRYTGVSSAYPSWFMHACNDTLDMEN